MDAKVKGFIVVILVLWCSNAMALTTYKGGRNQMQEPLPNSEGQLVYEEMGCAICHGVQGGGDGFMADGLSPRPRDFTDVGQMSRLSDVQMFNSIKDGRPGTAMPAWSMLTDDQIWAVVSYIKTFIADYQLQVSMCLNEEREIDLRIGAVLDREVDNPGYLNINLKGGKAVVSIQDDTVLKHFRERQTKVIRTTILFDGAEGSALLTVRIVRCLK